jgi:hypothetical protein
MSDHGQSGGNRRRRRRPNDAPTRDAEDALGTFSRRMTCRQRAPDAGRNRQPGAVLQRKLSWLEFNRRVLAEAQNPITRCSSGCALSGKMNS